MISIYNNLFGFIGNAICSLPLCHFFVYVLLLTPMFALETLKSPVFSLVHDWYHLNKRTAEGRSWCCFCQESQHVIILSLYWDAKCKRDLGKLPKIGSVRGGSTINQRNCNHIQCGISF